MRVWIVLLILVQLGGILFEDCIDDHKTSYLETTTTKMTISNIITATVLFK